MGVGAAGVRVIEVHLGFDIQFLKIHGSGEGGITQYSVKNGFPIWYTNRHFYIQENSRRNGSLTPSHVRFLGNIIGAINAPSVQACKEGLQFCIHFFYLLTSDF